MTATPSDTSPPIRLAILISGGGRTLLNLLDNIEQGLLPARVELVIADRECLGVQRAQERGCLCKVLPRNRETPLTQSSAAIFEECRARNVDLVVLAGFLSRLEIPDDFQSRVMNIHPSLIPAFCGAGMYGEKVHAAALERGCQFSGCTVHFCDNEYDHGPIVLQQVVPVQAEDTPASLGERVFQAECVAYPRAIRLFSEGHLKIAGRRVLMTESPES